ncbi:ATP-binding protein [Streptomyces sp. NPDC002187]|uniref:ATP-binding protein n=1 Tax=Streptomyces sp. NPDC002187 TaxID=3364637 RepID=UPI0036864EBF
MWAADGVVATSTQSRGDRIPVVPDPAEGESGRGLLLIGALADRWEVNAGLPPCKTVRAELDPPSL